MVKGNGERIATEELPDFLLKMLMDGGLLQSLKKRFSKVERK